MPYDAFVTTGNVLTFGVEPVRVDLMNDIDDISYAAARPNVVRGSYGGITVACIGLADLIQNKPTPRTKDKAAAEELRQD